MWWNIIRCRNKVNAVLIDTYSSSAYTYAKTCGALCRVLGLPYIPYLHGGGLPQRFQADFEASKKYISGGSAVVCPSGYLQKAVQDSFKISPIVIPNFIDISHYPFLKRGNLQLLRILWVRSFHESYQPHLAVEVLKNLNDKGMDVHLTMVGPNKDETLDKCQRMAETAGVSDRLTITGRLPKADWIALSASHNLFLNTTSVDNTPVSVMEAMALGLPVVTTKVGGIPFLFEDGKEGIMVEKQNSEALTDAILALKNTPERVANISSAARRKAEEWDWEVVRKQWIELLAE